MSAMWMFFLCVFMFCAMASLSVSAFVRGQRFWPDITPVVAIAAIYLLGALIFYRLWPRERYEAWQDHPKGRWRVLPEGIIRRRWQAHVETLDRMNGWRARARNREQAMLWAVAQLDSVPDTPPPPPPPTKDAGWQMGVLTGVRRWNVIRDGQGISSPQKHVFVWEPYKAMEAACDAFRCKEPPSLSHHPGCGIYASNLAVLEGWNPTVEMGDSVVGEVYLWGRYVKHEHGYRAQYAYPKAFFLPGSFPDWYLERVKGLAEIYGCEVREWKSDSLSK